MSNVNKVKEAYSESLERECFKNGIQFSSMQRLLDAEKFKKLIRRNAYVQQTIDSEIEKAISDEN